MSGGGGGCAGLEWSYLEELELRFILGAKRSDHQALFEWVEATERVSPKAVGHVEHTEKQVDRFRYLNGVPLNDTHCDLEVNFLEYEHRPNGKGCTSPG